MELALAKKENALGATLLIAGCCIGAGMVGLPVVSALAGFIPSTLAMLLSYCFATATGLLIVEATLWFDEKVNLISMAHFALGKAGTVITYSLFLFLFYCLFVAYIDGGGQIFANILSAVFQVPVAREIGILTCVGFVGASVYAGVGAVSGINRIFLLCLIASYCTLVLLGISHVNTSQLLHMDWKAALSTIPIMLVCFGYQNLVPTLTYYVKRNVSTLRAAILIGNAIPFVVYFIWNFVILGLIPDASHADFTKIVSQSGMVTGLLEKVTESQAVLYSVKAFSFFAIVTPFIASTLAFVDFLKDGFKMTRYSGNELLIYGLVLIPPTVFTFFYPHVFLKALGLVGGLADVLLFGVLPVTIVWIGRYVKKVEGPYTVAGGKVFLGIVLLMSLGFLLLRN